MMFVKCGEYQEERKRMLLLDFNVKENKEMIWRDSIEVASALLFCVKYVPTVID